MSAVFSTVSVTVTPGISTALLRSKWVSSWRGSSVASKYRASGQTRTLVPWRRSLALAFRNTSASTTSPPENASVAAWPSRQTLTCKRLDSALVTLTPTP